MKQKIKPKMKLIKQSTKNIYQLLLDIQKELKAPKKQFNKFANFNYRSCEDILEAVKPLLKGCCLKLNDEVVIIGNRYYVKATVKLSKNADEFVECSAYAREPESKKGMDEAMITGAASSYARKYALNGLFAIDDTRDVDTKNNKKIDTNESKAEKFEKVKSICEFPH